MYKYVEWCSMMDTINFHDVFLTHGLKFFIVIVFIFLLKKMLPLDAVYI